MRLSVEEITAWARDFYARSGQPFNKNVNWTRVAGDAGYQPVRLRVQRSREEIDAQTIINVARTHSVNPVDELARIPRWKYLTDAPSKPSTREVLCSLHPRYIFAEISHRLGLAAPDQRGPGAWDDYYGRFSTWIEVAGSDTSKERLSDALNLVSTSAMSNRLNSHTKFRVDEVIDGFTAANMDPIYALVLAGLLTDEEAGYPATLRLDVLTSVPSDDLLYMCQRQMRYTTRLLVEREQQSLRA